MTAIDDLTRLHHMQDAAREAIAFMSGKTRDDLANNRMLVLAVVKDLEIIGEAASRVSIECRARHPNIPWAPVQRWNAHTVSIRCPFCAKNHTHGFGGSYSNNLSQEAISLERQAHAIQKTDQLWDLCVNSGM